MVTFKENYYLPRFQWGGFFSRGGGGVHLFTGGSNCFFPIETHITYDFPGGQTPSGSAHVIPRIEVFDQYFSLFFFNITFAL